MAEKVVIIGSGPSGWAAAIYAARAELEPLVFEGAETEENRVQGTMPLGQLNLTTEVENYPGFAAGDMGGYLDSALPEELVPYRDPKAESHRAVTGPELMELMRQQAKNFGTRIVTDDIVEVDFSEKPFKLTPKNGDPVEAHAVIIATGARANWLNLESETKYKNQGVSACAVCDGALPRFRNKPLVVIGGGDSAMEEATYLTKFASQVHLVHRRDELRASPIMAERAKNHPKITIEWSTEVDEVLGDDKNGVTGVRLKSTKEVGETKEIEAGGMFVAIGHTPNTAFLNGQIELNEAGYIVWKTPFRTHTSVEGVFAGGDVADDHYRQAVTAAGTGCMAALDAQHYLEEHGLT